MEISALIESIKQHPEYQQQIMHHELLDARDGQFKSLESPLPVALSQLLEQRGIDNLFSHQVDSIEAVRNGSDLVVVTGTASGKTLCYNIPILETCLSDPQSRALYLYPTKALAQDQLKGLLQLLTGVDDPLLNRPQDNWGQNPEQLPFKPGVYDGDTPTSQRRRIKAESNLVLSNPDMLHAAILPYHPKWARFFSNLQYVVLDEVHMYRGILGANVACVLRRLKRVCQHYGSNPQFLSTSATIENPGELVNKLIGRAPVVVDNDGSPRGRKHFILWNPSELGCDNLARASANDDAVWWMCEAIEQGGQTLAFTRTRQAAELISRYAQQRLFDNQSPHHNRICAYRGGYLPIERRAMEQDLFQGRIRGVASTNALELGVDVGSLDVTLLVHYPGTIASTWQQAGRSGRRNDESLSVLLAGNEPVDQYMIRNPEYFFSQSPEQAVVDPENPYVLANHLKAAAFELPLDEDGLAEFGECATPITDILHNNHELNHVADKYYFSGGQNPAHKISLRHMSDNTFSIVEISKDPDSPNKVIANVDAISAPELVYPEAVYLHHGETFFIRELDLEGRVAYAERQEMDYYTQAVLDSNVKIQHELESRPALPDTSLAFGEVDVSWKTVSFKKIKFSTRENVGYGSVDIPAQNLPTTAFWFTPGQAISDAMQQASFKVSEGLCGLRNLVVVALPMLAMCDNRDISGVVDSKNLGTPTMIIYDRFPGGLGYSEQGYSRLTDLLELCEELVSNCQCDDGCPSCVGLPNLRPAIHSDPDLTRGYPIPDKHATSKLLQLILHTEASVGSAAEVLAASH